MKNSNRGALIMVILAAIVAMVAPSACAGQTGG